MRLNSWMFTPAAIVVLGGAPIAHAQPPAPSATKPSVPATPGEVDLRPKFKPGQITRYSFDQTAKSSPNGNDVNLPALSWADRLEVQLLYREAEALTKKE